MATAVATHNIGKVVQVIGPVLDVEFEAEHLPEIYNALRITGTAPDGDEERHRQRGGDAQHPPPDVQ